MARSIGFIRVGFARVEPLEREAKALKEWLAAKYHGTMLWMERNVEIRLAPDHPCFLPQARTVIAFAAPLPRSPSPGPLAPLRIARYAKSRDYHKLLKKRLQPIVEMLEKAGHMARPTVDSAPILERAWAQRAGIGFIGKNTMLIIPGVGSHVLLSTIVTTAELPPDEPMGERCGSCTRCLDACPTKAFPAPRVLDARRCISYLTIEHKGNVDPSLRTLMGDWLFGCDICQDVCPFNRTHHQPAGLANELHPDPRWDGVSIGDILLLDDERFDLLSRGSPLRRAGREGLVRNAAYALGNLREKRHLPVLQAVATKDPSPVAREAAAWAIEQIRT
ncbi:MAG: tRNA epoxyqueuosine(34) reductase QueG [Deltaproteobacteria bacterium]|nr:tRNA epoxyqueuosine(34) reductase QueG [Deltaproteobacteria bacterium]